nr:hypothetical protein [Paraburkholderia sp. J10-1]
MIEHMLQASPQAPALRDLLPDCLVEGLDDGRMGSVRFDSQHIEGRRLGADLCQMEFLDSDGVPVFVTLSLDNFGQLFELDMWKADFSAIQRFPLTH